MTIEQYVESIHSRYRLGNATEHTFRGDLQQLLESLVPTISVTNEPKRQSCGAPDYILTKKEIPIGFIEAKDIGDEDLAGTKKTGNKEQFDRYKSSLNNLIFTDYLDFHLYRDGQFVRSIRLAELTTKGIRIIPSNVVPFTEFINDFCVYIGQSITSSKKLAEMLASKAKLMAGIIEKALLSDEETAENSSLQEQMQGFKSVLIHDLTQKGFADVYAQTITYGMFAARSHDHSLTSFSRQEAYELIPKSNPFLKKLFGYIAGLDIDDRIKWIVDDLVNIFLACNVEMLLKDYGKGTQTEDPIIHFYEDFLSEYDPALRKARGVWYTPKPVVNFIVRAVDEILKTEFDLSQGLADTSKIKIKTEQQGTKGKIEKEIHKVQILDPATGTGTFLAEVIKLIYKNFEGQQGIWSNYVETHLLPRLNGFELLMASYAMAHLKLDLLLTETGYKPTTNQRFRVYLTNSLEESHPDTGTLFANWLSTEANEANHIKRDTPVMCVIGNPPYSINSKNKSEWIQGLIADYKQNLNEKKINLDDDYIKFIRYGEHFISRNGSGVLAYISNNSFIDGITHRQMRKHLMETFDKIYILDLHGFAKLKEIGLIADNDENVFDIQQGVSINIFIKTGNKKNCSVKYFEQYGTRNEKYDFLYNNSLPSIKWENLKPVEPYFFFIKKDFSEKTNNDKGFKINDLFIDANSGIKTDRDSLFYDSDKEALKKRFIKLLSEKLPTSFINEYNIKDSGSYKITSVIKNKKYDESHIQKSAYRPFDYYWNYYDPKLISRPAQKAMAHFNGLKNYGLVVGRQGQVIGHMQWNLVFCTSTLTDYNIFYRGGGYVFPLFLYLPNNEQQCIEQSTERIPNLNKDIVKQFAEILVLTFTNDKEQIKNTFASIDIFDYVYAVLHSPKYRDKYKEFLKIDFPRVPYPKDKVTFWKLVELGGELRKIHLFESSKTEKFITQYPVDGNNLVSKILYKNGKVTINDTQYFDNVPEIAWNFYIGGYQPAQKWLKDRKEKKLDYSDIFHYQKIIAALTETDKFMKLIDQVDFI